MGKRTCEGCGASLKGRRRDARFCGDLCRYRVWERGLPPERRVQRLTTAKQRAREARQKRRRPSRDGTGRHIYLSGPQLAEVRVLSVDWPEWLRRKVVP